MKNFIAPVVVFLAVVAATTTSVRVGPGWLASVTGAEESPEDATAALFKLAGAAPSDQQKVRDLCWVMSESVGIQIPDDARTRQNINRCASLGYL